VQIIFDTTRFLFDQLSKNKIAWVRTLFVSIIISLVAARKAASWSTDFVLKKATTDTFSLLFMVTKRRTEAFLVNCQSFFTTQTDVPKNHFPFAPRLSMSKQKFYAVAVGLKPGLYATWYVWCRPVCELTILGRSVLPR